MPPYYPDGYQQPTQQYYQNHFQQPQQNDMQGQYAARPNQVQVIVPQRQSQPYATPNYLPQYHQQYQQVHPHYQQTPAHLPNQNSFPVQYYNQQQLAYNAQAQERYQPPPPPQVIVPERPVQNQQSLQPPTLQQTSRPYQAPFPQMPVKQETPQARVLQNIEPNTAKAPSRPSPQSMTQAKPMTEQDVLSPQYPSLLLTLADEYIEASKRLKARSEDYYKLMATALGCINAALKNFKLSPIREAQVSLKYAQLLYDETDNVNDAESILTKSIDLCDRMKFVDLKYAMQLLLAKVLYRSKPRAAIRDLQGMISDIETYRHVAWEYPFRFQAVLFATQGSDQSSMHEAFHQLEKIQHTAKQNSDHVIYAFAAVLESLLHLKTPGPERIPNSERAYAKAREVQLNPDVEKHPQISVLLEFIDLMWSMNTADEARTEQKRKNLQTTLYKHLDGKTWNEDGIIWLPVNPRSLRGVQTQLDGLIHEVNGKYYMNLAWVNHHEIEAIGFLLNGVSIAPQNHFLRGRAEKYMTEGYKIPQHEALQNLSPTTIKDQEQQRYLELQTHFTFELTFMLCSRGQWDKAKQAVRNIERLLHTVEGNHSEFDATYDYLRGCIEQGIGNLDGALRYYQSPSLVLPKQEPAPSPGKHQNTLINSTVKDFAILAAVNTASIIRSTDHPQHHLLRPVLDSIGPAATNSHSPLINAAYTLLYSTIPGTQILRTKELLRVSLDTAKKISNHQIMGLTLTLMQDKFFRGGVQTAQAVKCAKAAAHQVKTRWGNPLWVAVSSMFEVESLMLVGGQEQDVQRKQEDADRALEVVPEGIRKALGV
ncbi:hypothetical protein H2198_000814 [Neophaeococcomyces mojaviensis]|uniref:Uncharacterized protein n=1 Tax=Neophaeococcomyces mojaviensis TaxID=3383035 RepID=A0ACC3AIY9_9EURO|nr:hypothetical protein H2198_000814 [Knufia sp. JES_112]